MRWVALFSFIREPGTNIMTIICFLDCFTFIYQKAWKKYYGLYICSGLVYLHILESPEFDMDCSKSMEKILWPLYLFWIGLLSIFLRARNKYYFRIALLSFIKEPGTNSMVIVFIPDCFSFIYQRVRNKYYGHYISSGLLYFHLPESPRGTN